MDPGITAELALIKHLALVASATPERFAVTSRIATRLVFLFEGSEASAPSGACRVAVIDQVQTEDVFVIRGGAARRAASPVDAVRQLYAELGAPMRHVH